MAITACGPPAGVGANRSVAFPPFLEPLHPVAQTTSSAGYRSLDWPQFDVSAHLDSSGTLHVRERQVIRFSGDWNGGERLFTVRLGQRFQFDRLLRVDSLSGAEVPLIPDAADQVDGYQWVDTRTLRWRSRLPTDAPFDNTLVTYILEYRYSDLLVPAEQGYVLDHEFAFRDRDGPIERFSLALTLDSAWRAQSAFAGAWREARLDPGLSFLVHAELDYLGAGRPSNVTHGADPLVAHGFVVALAAGLLGLTVRRVRDERALGRFDRVDAREITDTWLAEHVFVMLPEVAGTAWDDAVGPPEVAATLARLVSERKLSSRVTSEGRGLFRHDTLHLTLDVRRDALHGHERALVDALFESHARTTDTKALRTRYQSTGFNPASLIRGELMRQLQALPGAGGPRPTARHWPATMAWHTLGLALFMLAIRTQGLQAMFVLSGFGVGLLLYFVGVSQALAWRTRVWHPIRHLWRVLVPVFALPVCLLWLVRQSVLPVDVIALASLCAFGLAFGKAVLDAARSPHDRDRIRLRKRLVAARTYFREQLRSATPQLEQAWYPYLLAFGLQRQVHRWFKAFGAPDVSPTHPHGVGSAGSTWTAASGERSWGGFGGGGGFAGAGATVAFGAAVSGFSSGVSAPSSSSSGGSSSSSGGSSGGGGGGGW